MILTSTQMGVDAHIPRRPAQALSFAIGYMLLGFRVTILFGHTEIDHVDDLRKPKSADAKGGVVRESTDCCCPLSQVAQLESCRA